MSLFQQRHSGAPRFLTKWTLRFAIGSWLTLVPTLAPFSYSAQPADIMRALLNWFECEECNDGELTAVVSLGPLALPTLSNALLRGPSDPRLFLLRSNLGQTYDEMCQTGMSPPMTRQQYITTYINSYIALYRIRALRALGLIGGGEAKLALERALAIPSLPPHIELLVKDTLARLEAYGP